MAEPITTATTTTTTALISAISLSTLFPALDAGGVLGALCGATLMVINKKELSRVKSVVLFFISFLIGILFADFILSMIINWLPVSTRIPHSFGTFIVSIVVTQSVLLFLSQDIQSIIKIIRGKE